MNAHVEELLAGIREAAPGREAQVEHLAKVTA
jgi:hypothetical protein